MRKFTLRRNGQRMTTFRPKVSLTQEQIDWIVAQYHWLWDTKQPIEAIIAEWLRKGQEEFENQAYGEAARLRDEKE